MARYTGAVCRLCRRESKKLFLKGDRCCSDKCAVKRRQGVPGQSSQVRRKTSEYGMQFREKQKVKRYYGVLESKFKWYFAIASKSKEVTGDALLQLLELRFDNVVYRLGFARSRAEAKQLIVHGHFLINVKKVNISSYLLKVGDKISVKERSRDSDLFKLLSSVWSVVPSWLNRDDDKLEGQLVRLPLRDDVDLELKEHLIIELYSR